MVYTQLEKDVKLPFSNVQLESLMKHLAKEVWLTALTTISVTTQTVSQIAKAKVKPL